MPGRPSSPASRGFCSRPIPYRLRIAAARDPDDPADSGLNDGDAIGLLGIELHTRRRNRLNGRVRRDGATSFEVMVQQSFGNCPQYIQLRDFAFVRDPATPAPAPPRELDRLDDRARAMIAGADTFFVASYVDDAERGRMVDVSHRGGKPGFVRVGADGVLTIPDFSGNRFFNTLGNLIANPKAGLLFVDFETGDLLQLIRRRRGHPRLAGDRRVPGRGTAMALRAAPHRLSSRRAAVALDLPAGRLVAPITAAPAPGSSRPIDVRDRAAVE